MSHMDEQLNANNHVFDKVLQCKYPPTNNVETLRSQITVVLFLPLCGMPQPISSAKRGNDPRLYSPEGLSSSVMSSHGEDASSSAAAAPTGTIHRNQTLHRFPNSHLRRLIVIVLFCMLSSLTLYWGVYNEYFHRLYVHNFTPNLRIAPPGGSFASIEKDGLGRSCMYNDDFAKKRKNAWVCQDCSTQNGCHRLKPAGKCPWFPRQNWDPQRISYFDSKMNTHLQTDALYRYEVRIERPNIRYIQPQCTLLQPECFNLTKCIVDKSSGNPLPLSVYWEETSSFLTHLALQQGRIVRAKNPNEACLILRTHKEFSAHENWNIVHAPYWNHGKNHFIVGLPGDKPFHEEQHWGVAALAGSNQPLAHFRQGYDMAEYLNPIWTPNVSVDELVGIDRPILLSFKGTIRNNKQPYYQHRWLAAEYWESSQDVVVDVQCSYRDRRGRIRILKQYDRTGPNDYGNLLLNSTFGFAPGGSSVNSYRFLETLSAGCIPVVTTQLVPPLFPELDWSSCLIYISEARVIDLPRILRNLSSVEVQNRQRACVNLYKHVFGSNPRDHSYFFVRMMDVWSIRITNAWDMQSRVYSFSRNLSGHDFNHTERL